MATKEKELKVLMQLLKLPENTYCAECGARHPRWASYNLGIFVCLQCSGIHRDLGVDISKVRSITLDTWTPEMVKGMKEMGNQKSNAIWEYNLPQGRKPAPDDSVDKIKLFIKEKYQTELWKKKGSTQQIFRKKDKKKPEGGEKTGKKEDRGDSIHDMREGSETLKEKKTAKQKSDNSTKIVACQQTSTPPQVISVQDKEDDLLSFNNDQQILDSSSQLYLPQETSTQGSPQVVQSKSSQNIMNLFNIPHHSESSFLPQHLEWAFPYPRYPQVQNQGKASSYLPQYPFSRKGQMYNLTLKKKT